MVKAGPQQDGTATGSLGVALFMLGGLLVFVFPPLAVILILGGGLAALGGAVSSNRREEARQSTPALDAPPAPVQAVDQTEAAPEYFTCSCQNCGQRLEFPTYGAGTEVECPTCQQKTVLLGERALGDV